MAMILLNDSATELTDARGINESIHSVENNFDRHIAVLRLFENLLLFCGQHLTQEQRSVIEYVIATGLNCLSRGIVHTLCSLPDRKLRRVGSTDLSGVSIAQGMKRWSEPLRIHSEAQIQLVRLAMVDVTCPRGNGILSGNIPLLKLVAEMMQSHTSASCRYEARLVLATLNSILHPASIPLPATSAQNLIKNFMKGRHNNQSTQNTAIGATEISVNVSEAFAVESNQVLGTTDSTSYASAAWSNVSEQKVERQEVPFAKTAERQSIDLLDKKRKLTDPRTTEDDDDDIELPELIVD